MQSALRVCITAILISLFTPVAGDSAQENISEAEASNLAGLRYWNKLEQPAISTESGLQYKILVQGDGRKPRKKDSVNVHYRGLLLDGWQFDASYANDEPVKLKLRSVIKGWQEGIQLMPAGSVYVFLIPPELAYGERKINSIPPNSTLIFEIELFGVN